MPASARGNVGLLSGWNATTGESGWGPGMEYDLRLIDALMQAVMQDFNTLAPPGAPADGALYYVPAGGQAAWAGQDHNLAIWRADLQAWVFLPPKPGWEFNVVTESYARYRVSAAGTLTTVLQSIAIEVTDAAGAVDVQGALKLVFDASSISDEGSGTVRITTGNQLQNIPVTTQTTAPALSTANLNTYMRVDSTTALTIDIPEDDELGLSGAPAGQQMNFRQANTGQVTFAGGTIAAGGNVTLDTAETLSTRKQGSTVTLVRVAANYWEIAGDLEAAS